MIQQTKQETKILAAANNPDTLAYVGLYIIMLAKRTNMSACLMFVLNQKEVSAGKNQENQEFQKRIQLIQLAAAKADVRVDYLITRGVFAEEVARYLEVFDSPILVVGEGADRARRKQELHRVEELLQAHGNGRGRQSCHFIIVSGKNKELGLTPNSSIDEITNWISKQYPSKPYDLKEKK